VTDALLAHLDVALADLVGSSEGVGAARSVAKRGRSVGTASFRLGEHSRVFTEDGREVEAGSGESGLVAIGGPIPVGYYKDAEKSAGTFRTFAGRTWSVPGDWATVEADGTIRLLGRGSVCINTAGEKVYPEEVEEALKLHPAVVDANVVGVPDEKWGSAVTAVVQVADGADVSPAELAAHCRTSLAGYKCPKHVVFVDRVVRGPNGKADYRWAAAVAADGVDTRRAGLTPSPSSWPASWRWRWRAGTAPRRPEAPRRTRRRPRSSPTTTADPRPPGRCAGGRSTSRRATSTTPVSPGSRPVPNRSTRPSAAATGWAPTTTGAAACRATSTAPGPRPSPPTAPRRG
jgi:hypothetical protein